jgi:oxidoreductase
MEGISYKPISPATNLSALIIGGSGAVGREIIDILINSPNYAHITIPTRRRIEKWNLYKEKELEKIKFIDIDSLDDILNIKEFANIKTKFFPNTKFDTIFCCLGSRVKLGEEAFRKVDFEYVVNAAKLAAFLNVHHYSIVSSKGANANSCFLYLRVKGQADEELMKEDINCISVHRPGIIKDRDNDSRIGEKIVKYVPFLDKIFSKSLAEAIVKQDILIHQKNINQKKIYIHSEIESFLDSESNYC